VQHCFEIKQVRSGFCREYFNGHHSGRITTPRNRIMIRIMAGASASGEERTRGVWARGREDEQRKGVLHGSVRAGWTKMSSTSTGSKSTRIEKTASRELRLLSNDGPPQLFCVMIIAG
jgi:hypothetical protein